MTTEKLKRRRKIAIIFMPVNEVRPPVSLTTYGSAGDLVMDEIARRLARSHDVIAYCARGEDQQKIEWCDGVEYRRMSTSIDRWVFAKYQKTMRLIDLVCRRNAMQAIFNSALWYRQFIAEVSADQALLDCDIVHIMNLSQFVPFIRARVPKARIVLHMHCQWLEEFDAAVIGRRIDAADLVLGVSDFIAAGVRRRFPSFAERCSHIHNGADIPLFARPAGVLPKPKQLLYVGRLAPEKGVHVLLDAFQMVLAHHPDAHLELIGQQRVFPLEALFPGCQDPHLLEIESYFRPGAYAELLRAKISEFPSGAISFLNDGLKFSELAPHYHAAAIFAFPSVCEESFGMPLVEAMASATPVVATRGGAFPEIVEHGRTGLLVERSDAPALADAILQLLSSPDQRDAMARAAVERVSTMFSWDCIAEDLVEKYESILA
ncbi:MAG TPA: glycosyltransferase family 4 protein [Pseudolabrys sp.]|nr:glycosyltransferase family 4 protein [Pseudolabrys sp.]